MKDLNCEDCDRNNVLKCFCYFSKRHEYYTYITDDKFSVQSFAVFAVEMDLSWIIPTCRLIPRSEFSYYWSLLYPYLVYALQHKLAGEPIQAWSKNDVD